MRKGLVNPVTRDSGQERIPLVGVRTAEGARNGFLRAGSCLGDPQVRNQFTNVANWAKPESAQIRIELLNINLIMELHSSDFTNKFCARAELFTQSELSSSASGLHQR